ncbi:TolC family protein [Pseudodesulfovibrio sp. zrk46]|uniref:TolC family protein n=1 Tax=Pseudodesulfovibrio sp. zrk46 TaxID=2725288 RepID=UPI001448A704|nr:TolC family protein [Pseudodesulfovibrio sp. zrk46]QJB58017.1 TolC family protein [Pseudodesulfovibrio sp. zrk46]
MRLKRVFIFPLILLAVMAFSVTAMAMDADPAPGEEQAVSAMDDYTGDIDLERAVKRALELNPQMTAIRAQLTGSQFGTRSAFGNFLPEVGGSYGYTNYGRRLTSTTRRHDDWVANVNVTQPIFKGFNLLATWQRAKLTEESNQASLDNVELTLISSVQSNFLSLLKARMDVKSAEDSVARLESQLKVISAFYEVGLRPKAEVLDAEVDLATARQDLLTAKNSVSTQMAQLNTLLNIPLEADANYVGQLKDFPFSLTLQDCLSRAYKSRPDLIIGKKSVEIAEKDSTIAASSFYPSVEGEWNYYNKGVDAGLSRDGVYPYTSKEYYTVGVTASMTLFEWGADYYDYKKAEENVKQVEAQLEETRLNAGFEVKTALLNINEAADRIEVAKKSVAAAEEAYRMAVARYQAQVGTNTDVLNAQSRLTTSEAQLSQALADYGTSVSTLFVAMGEKNLGLNKAE